MADRAELIAFLDDLLEPEGFDDLGPNGLQVPGADRVELVVTGVSAGLELFEKAAAAGADLVLCHHGLFWNFQRRSLTVPAKRRLQALFDADMSLAAYHLPLDAHPEHGNNALICSALGLDRGEPFGLVDGRPIGVVGRSARASRRMSSWIAAERPSDRSPSPGSRDPTPSMPSAWSRAPRTPPSPRPRSAGSMGCSPVSRRSM